VELARRLGESDLPAAGRDEWERRQLPVVHRCAWIAQNIRFPLLLTAVVGQPTLYLWIALIPLNLVALALVMVHERNARDLLQSLAMPAPNQASPAVSPGSRAAAPPAYRGVIVGVGGIAMNAHLPGFLRDPRVEKRLRIVAGVDGVPNGHTPDFPVVHSVDDLLEFEPIDFVDICTPTASHLPLTLWALQSGYHVLCEKPVAVSRAEAEQVARAARAAGKVVFPCHQYRFNPVWRQIRKWIAEGAIGRWHLAELSVHRLEADRGAAKAAAPWRGQRDSARGGVLLDHGTHLLYTLMDIAGPPTSVDAWTAQLRHSYDVEDTANVVLEYPNAMATMFLTWAGQKRENHIRFIGEHGTISWSGGALTLETAGRNESVDLSAQMDKSSYVGWFSDLFHAFANAVDEQDIETHLADITNVATVLEAAYDSAASRRPRLITVG
jgi:predicted dehydrogenase